MKKHSLFPIYGAVRALMRKKGEQSWSSFGCFGCGCTWYWKSDLRYFCDLSIGAVGCIRNSCDFEFAVKVGHHIFLLVEQDGKFALPVELVD